MINLKSKKFKYYLIYVITNKINNKKYVGFHATNNIFDTYMGSGLYLHNAFKKYGKENFKKDILEECNHNNWQEREKYWIEKLETYGNNKIGYNLTKGGDGTLGLERNFSNETKIKMSQTRKKLNLAKGKNNGMYGKNHSKRSIERMINTRIEEKTFAGKNNPRFDKNIYTFYNIETKEYFIGFKYDLCQLINSKSSDLNSIIKGKRKQHKNWIIIK